MNEMNPSAAAVIALLAAFSASITIDVNWLSAATPPVLRVRIHEVRRPSRPICQRSSDRMNDRAGAAGLRRRGTTYDDRS